MKRTRDVVISSLSILAIMAFFSACAKQEANAAEKSTKVEMSETATATADVPAALAVSDVDVDPSTVIISIGSDTITEGDLQKEMARMMRQFGGQIPMGQLQSAMPEMRARLAESLIMNSLLRNAVSKEGVQLPEEEFNEIKSELTSALPPGQTLETQLDMMGVTEAEIREQMTFRKLIMSKADAVAKPTDEEVKAFYDENSEYFTRPEMVSASHILIKFDAEDTDATKAEKRAKLEALRQDILSGGDFAELAKANSDCPSSREGGNLGDFGRGQMVPEFENAAFSQEIGVVGEIVETQFGLHLILVSDRKEAGTIPFDEVKTRISDMLYAQNQNEAVESYLDSLRKAADIEIKDDALASAMGKLDDEDDGEELIEVDVEELDID